MQREYSKGNNSCQLVAQDYYGMVMISAPVSPLQYICRNISLSSSLRGSMWKPRVRLLNKVSTATVALLAAPGVTPGVDPPVPRLLYLCASVSHTCGRQRGLLSLGVSQAKSSSFCTVLAAVARKSLVTGTKEDDGVH
ncbi:hypothetical protein ElyMa_005024500 [Elysia marginata]|uniref:Uncharacterized protein n=1 Tax=Elysia marginata TaxID=1093978 RepID=A0AAV4J8M9_9GAST|nr:hypothetical protein ElyMa_005024500 [Elysia marginata]